MWCLTALGGLARFGGPALGNSPSLALEIDGVAKRYLKHKDAEVRKCAAKLIRRLVRGLADTYPLGTGKEGGEWGMAMRWDRLSLVWHQPRLRDLDLASRILAPHLESTLGALERVRVVVFPWGLSRC